jgi:hypothetical protein
VLRHFSHRNVEYALPRVLLVTLDTATLARHVLDPAAHHRVVRSPALADLLDAARSLLDELGPPAGGAGDGRGADAVAAHVARTTQRLAAAGARPRRDLDAATRDYAAARAGWSPRLHALAGEMLHDWAEIAPVGA